MTGFIPWTTIDLALRAGRTIWLSTTRPDGRPHAVPVWYIWDGRHLYFITRRGMQKAKNLAWQPWAVLHQGDGDDVIILQGPVQTVTDRAELDRIDRLYGEKYVDPHSGTKATIFDDEADLYRVDVKQVMAWEYGVVATRSDWSFDEGANTQAPVK